MKLDEALREASAAADRSTARALPGPPPPSPSDRRPVMWVAGGAVVLVAGLMTVMQFRAADTSIATAADADSLAAQPNGEDSGASISAGLPRFVSDAPPDGLSLEYAGPAAEQGSITGTEIRWVYGHRDRGPVGDERPVTVMALSGAQRPSGLLDGVDVDINGATGRVLADGTVMFELGDAMISVFGDADGEDLVALARSVGVSATGQPVLPETTPGGYALLGSFDGAVYGDGGVAVAADAEISTYRQGYVRYLDFVSTPRTVELEHMYRWLTPADAETLTVDETTFTYLYSHDEFGAPATYVLWFDAEVIGTAISYGIEREEVDEALSALRTDGDPPIRADRIETDVAIDEPTAVVDAASIMAAAPTIVLDGMEIVNAVDHSLLGVPDWSSRQYLYGPADIELPGSDDPILVLSVTQDDSDDLLIGEPIKIGGHDGVIVDKASAGTAADIELRVGDTTVQVTGRANLELEQVIAAAEQYTTWVLGTGGSDVGPPSNIGVDLTLRYAEDVGVWDSEDVNGSFDANTIVYAEPGTTSETGGRRLSVSSNNRSSRSVEWLSWLYADSTTTIDLGETGGTLTKPRDGITVLRFESDGRVIEIIGTETSESEVLAAADMFLTSTTED